MDWNIRFIYVCIHPISSLFTKRIITNNTISSSLGFLSSIFSNEVSPAFTKAVDIVGPIFMIHKSPIRQM